MLDGPQFAELSVPPPLALAGIKAAAGQVAKGGVQAVDTAHVGVRPDGGGDGAERWVGRWEDLACPRFSQLAGPAPAGLEEGP